jgi:hypothetical protein
MSRSSLVSDIKSDRERRKFYRVRLAAQLALGPSRMQLMDDPAFAVRLRHADLVDSVLEMRKVAEPELVDSVDRGIDYLLALQDLVTGSLDTRPYEDRELSLTLDQREISLSEGGLGFEGQPPCELGEELTAVLVTTDHPSRRPIPLRVRLVRRQDVGDRTYLGFEFAEVPGSVQRHLVDLVFREQRRQLREARQR